MMKPRGGACTARPARACAPGGPSTAPPAGRSSNSEGPGRSLTRARRGRVCRSAASGYITSTVSITSIEAPPASTGHPFASATAASRLSALRIV